MQTFLPYPSFISSARVLDWKRLGKQRVEAQQILDSLEGRTAGWKNHPAVKMWAGYEDALKYYISCMIDEWVARGYNNNMTRYDVDRYDKPHWLGDDRFHSSHRSNLLRKNYCHYSQFNWQEGNDIEYFWPGRSPI